MDDKWLDFLLKSLFTMMVIFLFLMALGLSILIIWGASVLFF